MLQLEAGDILTVTVGPSIIFLSLFALPMRRGGVNPGQVTAHRREAYVHK